MVWIQCLTYTWISNCPNLNKHGFGFIITGGSAAATSTPAKGNCPFGRPPIQRCSKNLTKQTLYLYEVAIIHSNKVHQKDKSEKKNLQGLEGKSQDMCNEMILSILIDSLDIPLLVFLQMNSSPMQEPFTLILYNRLSIPWTVHHMNLF